MLGAVGGGGLFDDQKKHEILELAVEDATPLFDVTNMVGPCFPDSAIEEHIRIARLFVMQLLAKGYVKLVDEGRGVQSFQRRFRELNAEETQRELWDQANWVFHEPRDEDKKRVCMAATTEGENAVFRCTY